MNTADTITAGCAKLQAARARRIIAIIESNGEIIPGDPDSALDAFHRGYLLGLCRTMADSIDKLALWTRAEDAPAMDGCVLLPELPTYKMAEAMGVKWETGEGFPRRYAAMIAAYNEGGRP